MNIVTNKPLPRRTVLKGLGAAVALPMLEAMVPARSLSAAAGKRTRFLPSGVNDGSHV